MSLKFISPDWPLADKVNAFTTTRLGGVSVSPYNDLNLALHVGDQAESVIKNRSLLNKQLPIGVSCKWINQTHSNIVVNASEIEPDSIEADASFTIDRNIVCAVLTADCLPILFSDQNGECVGVTHVGWRGLLDGIIQKTIEAMSAYKKPDYAWLGPAIGPTAFEVGEDIYTGYIQRDPNFEAAFTTKVAGKWNFDIYLAAKVVLSAADIPYVYGGVFCTYNDEQQFFSYRRNAMTGRMATLITRR